jgi:hypothetical protein
VIWLIEILFGDQADLDTGFQQMKMRREMRGKFNVFSKWNNITKASLPVKRDQKRRMEIMELACQHRLMRTVLLAFHSGTIGKESTKVASQERKKLIESIRGEMSEKLKNQGEIGIVMDEDVRIAVERKVCMDYIASKKKRDMNMIFKAFKLIVQNDRENCKLADYKFFKVLVGKCFISWSDHVYLVSVGLDRQKWPGPRQYEVRYNRKRVANFARFRCLRLIFVPWKSFHTLQMKIKKAYQRSIGKFMKINFTALKVLTQEQHRLRVMVVDNWRSYARLMVNHPIFDVKTENACD